MVELDMESCVRLTGILPVGDWVLTVTDTKHKCSDEPFYVEGIIVPRAIDDDINFTVNDHTNCWCSIKYSPAIRKVIFNPPATIILWSDGTKSVVKCQNGEPFDAEKGFALAYLKKLMGNDNTFNKEIHKWVVNND